MKCYFLFLPGSRPDSQKAEVAGDKSQDGEAGRRDQDHPAVPENVVVFIRYSSTLRTQQSQDYNYVK